MQEFKSIYCCNCEQDVNAVLKTGGQVYKSRTDLENLTFWKCEKCKCFVGCHHKTSDPKKPLGVIPSFEIKEKRKIIHNLLDPIWKQNRMRRGEVYKALSDFLKCDYHTAELRTVDDCENVIEKIKSIRKDLGMITF